MYSEPGHRARGDAASAVYGPPRHLASAAILFVWGALAFASPARTQTLRDDFWMPNGPVNAIAITNNTAYLGGSFSRIGPPTGAFVGIDATTGVPIAPYPPVLGLVSTAVEDGGGGWYIGGVFTAVAGQPRSNLAHIDASGNLTPWNPGADNIVHALARDFTTGIVYVGGEFHNINGKPRSALAAIDGVTGVPTEWKPNPLDSIPGRGTAVYSIILDGSTVYVGGSFTSIGGQARNNLASVDATSGAATGWNPDVDKSVLTMRIRVSYRYPFTTTLYIGGGFNSIGGQVWNYLAAVDGNSGAPFAWNPDPDGIVRAMLVTGGLTANDPIKVYASGDFNRLGAQTRHRLGAVNDSGLATGWVPSVGGSVFTLASANNLIYLGGGFTTVDGQPRTNLASVDPGTGGVSGWDPGPNSSPYIIVGSGSTLFVGGAFSSVGGLYRNNLAALDLVTGQPTSWDPNVNGPVSALLLNGGTIFVGGQFTSIGGYTRNHVGAIDLASGALTGWNPDANGDVKALAMRNVGLVLDLIYMGGSFTTVRGQTRYYLAAMNDAPIPELDGWHPFADNTVFALFLKGSRIYVGGGFTGSLRAFNWDGSINNQFNPGPDPNCIVGAIVATDQKVYVGGRFSRMGGRYRDNLAVLDTSGSANTWDPFTNDKVESLALSGTTLYVGGAFSRLGNEPRDGLGTLDLTNGLIGGFGPHSLDVFDIGALVVANNTVYVGGNFIYDGLARHWYFAAFSDATVGISDPVANAGADELRLSANPFRGRLDLRFGIPETGTAEVAVYDAAGRLVRWLPQGVEPAGEHHASWDGRDQHGDDVSAGIYFVRVQAGSRTMTAKALRLR